MRDIAFIAAQPIDKYFTWQVAMWLQSLQDIGLDDRAHVVLYKPKGRKVPSSWFELVKIYDKATFAIYEDDEINQYLGLYIPVLRPAILQQHFEAYPELAKKAIFYCDCDVIFTKAPQIGKYLADDICYLSDTNSYISSDYIIGKERDVLADKKEAFSKVDVLGDMCSLVGIDKQKALDFRMHSGGAQYLLKNIDASFWKKVKNDCLSIRQYLMNINRQYFASEEKGYQSWCADMWAVLYNIWHREMETKVVDEMKFAWSTDKKGILDYVAILHNAGITSDSSVSTWKIDKEGKSVEVKGPAFYKGRFHTGFNPLNDTSYTDSILNNPVSQEFCTHYYTDYLVKLKDKIWQAIEKS